MRALGVSVIAGLALAGAIVASSGAAGPTAARKLPRRGCGELTASAGPLPAWATQRRVTLLVDSVLLGASPALPRAMRDCHFDRRGEPALQVRVADRQLRRSGRRVAPLVIVGLAYNSQFERHRRHYAHWAAIWDREARHLLQTLHALGARQIIWPTLRRPTAKTVPRGHVGELHLYSWYFGYVNERLRLLDRRKDVALARWDLISRRPGITIDSIHVNPRGARLYANMIKRAIRAEARRQAHAAAAARAKRRLQRRGCAELTRSAGPLPAWATQRRATMLVDSVLLGASPAVRRALPDCRMDRRGRPALMVKMSERELRRSGRRVAPLVIVGLAYNSLFEHHRRRYAYWAARWDREALRLIHTLHRLGAKQIVWITLRRPNAHNIARAGFGELHRYSWYFGYVNERLLRLDRRKDVALARWDIAGRGPGLVIDSIHVNPRGARLMGRTIKAAIRAEAQRQARA
jgi:hypothetical protein